MVCLGASGLAAWYYPWMFAVGVLTLLLVLAGFYLWKFVRIIWILEDDLGQATQALEEVESSMQTIIEMKLFFDDQGVQDMVKGVMESVRMAQFSVNKMIKSFTDRSKQKYVMIIEEEPEPTEAEKQEQQQQEGTVASVERSNI